MRADDRLGFTVKRSSVRWAIHTPRYYDPSIDERLDALADTHRLISLQELIHSGELELRQGKYISKMHYGTGPIPYVRTSDIANWELRGTPKHGISEAVAELYRSSMDVRVHDVLLVHEGTYLIGTPCLITEYDTDILFQHHIAKLRVSGSLIDGPLLMAALLAPIVQRQIRARQFTADVIDSIVGRLPEVRLPIPKDAQRQRALSQHSADVFRRRAEARARMAALCRQVDGALANGYLDRATEERTIQEHALVSFLGGRTPARSFTVPRDQLFGDVYVPRYYDPSPIEMLESMRSTCDLVTVGELVRDGILELQTGDEVGRLSYGLGEIPFVRTSDFGNWELKHDPKQRVAVDVHQAYSRRQSVQARDILMVRDGTYLVGTTTYVHDSDLPMLFSGGIYRLRVTKPETLSPSLLFALLNSKVVFRQIRSKQFTRDVIDTLGPRLSEVVIPIPRDQGLATTLGDLWDQLLTERSRLRAQAARLGRDLETGPQVAERASEAH